MLQRVEAEVGQVGGLGVAEDAEDAAFVFEFVEHLLCSHAPRGTSAISRVYERMQRRVLERQTYPTTACLSETACRTSVRSM